MIGLSVAYFKSLYNKEILFHTYYWTWIELSNYCNLQSKMVNICYCSIIWTIVFSILVMSAMADYLDDESFGMVDNPSWWQSSEPDESNGNLINPEEDQINVDRRGFNRYLSKHKGVIPYYLHKDGINYGGRPGPASTRLWGSRLYGMSKMRPSFGLVSVNSRGGPFGVKK